MNVQRFLYAIDEISTWVGKTVAWLIIALMLVVCAEVFNRYILNAPTAWIFDAENMLYGTFFMIGGAYTLAQTAHAGLARPRALPRFLYPRNRRARLRGILLRVRLVAHRRAFDRDGGRPAGLPVQGDDSAGRNAGDAARHCRDRA